jgi:hypothetical protein
MPAFNAAAAYQPDKPVTAADSPGFTASFGMPHAFNAGKL